MTLFQRSRVKAAALMFVVLVAQCISVMAIRHSWDNWSNWQPVVIALLGLYLLVRAMNEPAPTPDSNQPTAY